jgi:hypothetical protein
MDAKRAESSLEPYAVPIPEARRLLGNKAHSTLYEELGRGRLVAIKDGSKTLITVESIQRYMANLPAAKIKPPRPRRPHPDRRRRKRER